MRFLKNPFLAMALVALVVQSVLLVFFYSLPDPLGLSMSEMFEGKTKEEIEEAIEKHGGKITIKDTLDLELARK